MSRDDYEERQEQRKDRLLKRASRTSGEAKAAYEAADRIAKSRPLGQPIIVGHHSERGARADQRRIERNMRKSIEKDAHAAELKRRAEAVGTGGISSDDPTAVEQLQAKLRALQARRDLRKAINAAWRKHGRPTPDDVVGWERVNTDVQLAPEHLQKLRDQLAGRSWDHDKTPFPAYALTNIGARIRDVQRRLSELEKESRAEQREEDCGVCRILEVPDENRIQLVFDGKPAEKVRALLKRHGFRWSPKASAWQRHLNDAGRLAARSAVAALQSGGAS